MIALLAQEKGVRRTDGSEVAEFSGVLQLRLHLLDAVDVEGQRQGGSGDRHHAQHGGGEGHIAVPP